MAYHTRGRVVCKNGLEVPLEATERAVLAAVEHDLLRIEILETSLAKALDLLRPAPDVAEGRSGALREDLARLDLEVSRLASAIAAGGDLSALLAALQNASSAARGYAPNSPPWAASLIVARLTYIVCSAISAAKLTDWQGLLRQEAPQARQALSALRAGRLVFTPRGDERERYYEFAGPG